MTISEKVAYIKGLAKGMELENEKSKEAKLIGEIISVLEEVGTSLTDLEENELDLAEEIDVLSDDLADVEEVVFGDEDDEIDDDYFEVACPNCDEAIFVDEDDLAAGEITCPNCGERFALDLADEEEPEDK